MRLPEITFPVLTLMVVNLLPLAGVLFFGWEAAVIILIYWTENLVIGFYNILRMIVLRVESPLIHLQKLFAIPFFCIHFGGFCAGHGAFILAFFNLGQGADVLAMEKPWPLHLVFLQLLFAVISELWRSHPPGMGWIVACLACSHGISFVQNYIRSGEYKTLKIGQLMSRPYKRIALLHVAIIAGGIPVMMLGSPIPLLFVLVFLKIGLDVWLHTRSHRGARSGGRAA